VPSNVIARDLFHCRRRRRRIPTQLLFPLCRSLQQAQQPLASLHVVKEYICPFVVGNSSSFVNVGPAIGSQGAWARRARDSSSQWVRATSMCAAAQQSGSISSSRGSPACQLVGFLRLSGYLVDATAVRNFSGGKVSRRWADWTIVRKPTGLESAATGCFRGFCGIVHTWC